ncbi:MAG: hypothetical protein FWG85_00745 [Bacteroidetes bacterium]|nr:hypothetical protein [Bacteroidota bacterium]
MGKGSQAKVYFVLYLAIVVELLIIIVERDEAEEHLHKMNNETMKIVESILSQLYSGSGSEGINTKPQDEITLPADADMAAVKEIFGSELKTWRRYQIDVGVTDVTLAIKRKEGENAKEYEERLFNMLSLANVEDLEYQIFFIPTQSTDTMPSFHSDDYIRTNDIDFMSFQNGQSFPGPNGEPWQFIGAYKLSIDKQDAFSKLDRNNLLTTLDFVPVYKPVSRIGNGASPRGQEDSSFFYSDIKTRESFAASDGKGSPKRSFLVGFEPPDRTKAGLYKLRFASKTNRILGVTVLEDGQRRGSDEETKVNIGTVQLTVKDLKKVAVELKKRHNELDKVPAVDDLSNASGSEIASRLDAFNAAIEDAKSKAETSDNSADLIAKIRLYEYIARLVIPGQSANFDQNRSNFDINVRVQTAKPSTAKPYVSMLSANKCFTNAKHVLEIEAGPYKTNNKVTGRVLGSYNADITFVQDGATPERDKQYKLRGTVNNVLPAGKYVIEITHDIAGKFEVFRDTLTVYEAGIQEETRTNTRVRNRIVYGKMLAFDLFPNSGNEVQANQFKTIVTFDGGNERSVNGYKVTRDAGIMCKAEYNTASVKLVWVQPITYQEFELYSTNGDLKLEEPSIFGDMIPKYSSSGNKIKIEATGLQILSPETGLDDKNAVCRMPEPKLRDGSADVNGYSISSQPQIVGGDANNGYIIELEIQKNPGVNVKSAEGSITIPVTVTATHPTNGKTSVGESEIILNINYTQSAARPSSTQQKKGTPAPKKAPAPKKK